MTPADTNPRSTGLRFVAHASLLLEDDDGDLLLDPWFFGDVFNGCCRLLAPPDLEALDLSGLRHVWISHTHPDHLHVPTLQWIRDEVDGPLTAFVRRDPSPVVRDAMSDLGYDVIELRPGRERRVNDHLALTMFTGHHDSAVVIRHHDRVIFNQNDTPLDDRTLRRIARRFPAIDVWLFQFSFGGYAANADDPAGVAAVHGLFREALLRYEKMLRPTVFVPIASYVNYVKKDCAFLNDHAVTPSALVEQLPDLPIQVPWGGEEILLAGWEESSRVNEDRWREQFDAPVEIKPPEPVTEEQLLAAGRDLIALSPPGLGPPEIQVQINETGRAAVFDFSDGRFEIIDRPDPTKLAFRLPAEELLYFCGSPYGADIVYGACVHVDSPAAWHWLHWYRASLEPGEPSSWRAKARRRAAIIEVSIAGGRARAFRQRMRLRRAGVETKGDPE